MPDPEHISLAVQGLRFDGLRMGPEDGELVLLLHGFPQFADSWMRVMAVLAGVGYRVVAVDQRGYSPGARPADVEEYGLERLTRDVLGFADALGAERFHLAGHDWGGLLAWQVAALDGGRVRSATVISTPHTDAFQHALRTDPQQMYKSKYMLLFKAPGHVAEAALLALDAAALRRSYQGKVAHEQVERNVARMREGGALTPALNWYRALSPEDRCGRIAAPVLYVWGDADVALGETAALGTAGFVDGPYRFERVQGGSHWLLDEMPEQIAAWMLDWMRGR